MRKAKWLALLAMLPLLLGACSDDEETPEHESMTTAEVESTVADISTLLDQMVTTYEAGDAEEAGELAAEAYLENYEHLEHTVEEVDEELNETIETILGTQMREKISEGVDSAELGSMVDQVKALLDDAVAAVKEAA